MLKHIPRHLLHDTWSKEPTYTGVIIRSILSLKSNSIIETHTRRQHAILMEALTKCVEIQISNMLKNYEVTNKRILVEKFTKFLYNLDIPIEVRALVHLSSWFTKIMDQGARCRRRQGRLSLEDYEKYLQTNSRFEYPDLDLIVIFGENINVVIISDKIWVMPYAGITLIQNKLADIISVLLFSYFSSYGSLPENAYQITLEFIRELAYLLREYKNKFFTIAKSLESLCIAETLQEHEEWKNGEFDL